MFCQNCGAKIEEGLKFCPGCGKAISGATVAPIAQQPVVSQAQTLMADEKYCFSCGSVIKKIAEICPKCGVRQEIQNSKAIIAYSKNIELSAIICFVSGIIGLVFFLFLVYQRYYLLKGFYLSNKDFMELVSFRFAVIFSLFGLSCYVQGRKAIQKKRMATIGLILSITGLALTIILVVINYYLQFAIFK